MKRSGSEPGSGVTAHVALHANDARDLGVNRISLELLRSRSDADLERDLGAVQDA